MKKLTRQYQGNSDALCHRESVARGALVAITLLAWLLLILPASGLGVVRPQDPPTIKLNTHLVTVNVSVTDRKRRPVRSLTVDDFVVVEDGHPVKPEFFSSGGPVSIVFVLDISGSMSENAKAVRDGFRKFLGTAHGDSDYTLVTFNSASRVLAQSVSADELWQVLSGVEPFGDTSLYDAILLGLQALDQTSKHHRALVIVSDGEDNRSRASIAEVGDAVSARHATVYTVGIASERKSLIDQWRRGLLTQLAEVTGGLLQFPAPREISKSITEISYDLRNQYSLGYYAPEGVPGWRNLRVSLASTPQRHHLRYKERYLTR